MKRKYIQILLVKSLTFLIFPIAFSCNSSTPNLHCNSLEDLERQVIKQHHIQKRTSVISQIYNQQVNKMIPFTGENTTEEIYEYDKNGFPIKKSVWHFGFNEMDINEYEYDKLGRVSQISSPKDQRKYSIYYISESSCRKSSMVGYLNGARIDSIAFIYSDNYKQTTINYLFHERQKAEVLDTVIYLLDDKDQIIESENRKHHYEYNPEGRLIRSESTDKKSSKKVAYVYQYADGLLVKSFRYENEQLVQINEIQYEYYKE